MTALRVSTWLWASAGTLAVVGVMTACSLNPQPLPPDSYGGDGAAGAAAADGSAVLLGSDSTVPSTGPSDASGTETDAKLHNSQDSGSSRDGATEASSDAEEPDAADATPDGTADGTTDAAPDADDAAHQESD